MMRALGHSRLDTIPKVPFAGCVDQGAMSTTTTNEDSTTFTDVSIGAEHPKRVVAVMVYHGVAALCTVTINGKPCAFVRQDEVSAHWVDIPNGTTASVTITAASSLRKAFRVFVCYPASHMPLGKSTVTAGGTTDAVISNFPVHALGCTAYGGSQSVLGTYTTTWSEADAVNESIDAQLEASISYTFGYINHTVSSSQNTLTMAETTSGNKRLARVTFGSPGGLH
jgi:hypothetical protein